MTLPFACLGRSMSKIYLNKFFKDLTLITVICLASTTGCESSGKVRDNRYKVLDSFIEELAMRGQFNGNILIAEKGAILFQRAIGIRSPEPGDMLNLDSQFNLASASKPFTALAIMQLMEAGALHYEDPIEKFLHEWPYREVTIRNLLNHTSGIPNHRGLLDRYWKPELRYDDPERLIGGYIQLVDLYIHHRPDPLFAPGEAYEYSDINYILLAEIIERVSEVPFHQYMREHVFLPAGMFDTYSYCPRRNVPLVNRARGMQAEWNGSGYRIIDFRYIDSLEGASGIYSTLEDLFRWDQALYTDHLVPQTTLAEAFAPGVLSNGETTTYGLGWSLYLDGCVSHDGYAEGYGVWINRDLEAQRTIIIMSNQGNYLWAGIIQGIRRVLQGEAYEIPKLDGTVLIGQAAVTEGERAAYDLYEELKQYHSDEYDMGDVNSLNTVGRRLLHDGYDSEALIVFRLNTEEYPESALVWFSLGDGYLSVGDTTNAVLSFQQALNIEPEMGLALERLHMLP